MPRYTPLDRPSLSGGQPTSPGSGSSTRGCSYFASRRGQFKWNLKPSLTTSSLAKLYRVHGKGGYFGPDLERQICFFASPVRPVE